MTQLCVKSMEPLKLLSKTITDKETFLEDWKNSKVVPIHKKESKNLIKDYRPIGILSVLSNILEKLIFNSLFHYDIQVTILQVK